MKTTVRELAASVGGRVVGDPDVEIRGVAGIERAAEGQVAFVAQEKWRALLPTTKASAVVVEKPFEGCPAAQIVVADANLAFARIVADYGRGAERVAPGAAPGSFVDPTATVDPSAFVGPSAFVAAGAKIGPRTVVSPSAYVGRGASLGADCLLHPHAVVLDDVRVGDRCIIHSGAVLGADGFGYATDAKGVHRKIPQIGIVVVEDDVEIGANACVDRARFDETRIGRGSKIDNLVQIGHNVELGPDCLLVAHSGVAGSSKLGRGVVIGAMSGVTGHVNIGDYAQVSAMSGVSKDIEGGRGYLGVPVLPFRDGLRARMLMLKLPELLDRLKAAEAKIAELEARLGAGGDGT